MNIEALKEGYRLMSEQLEHITGDFVLEPTNHNPHLYMIGNDAIGLGALSPVLDLWCISNHTCF